MIRTIICLALLGLTLIFTGCSSLRTQAHDGSECEVAVGKGRPGYLILNREAVPIEYTEVDGLAIFEGDIVLGTVQEMGTLVQLIESGSLSQPFRFTSEQAGIVDLFSIGITNPRKRWKNKEIPYVIDQGIRQRKVEIEAAMAHWTTNTPLRFVNKRPEHANYIVFKRNSGTSCYSSVGMVSGPR